MERSPAEWRKYLEQLLGGEAPRIYSMEDGPEPELELALPGISRLILMGHGPFRHFESAHIWGHVMCVIRALDATTKRRLNRFPSFVERFAALTHDIAKPDTRVLGPEGATSFPGHERLSADYLAPLLPRLGFTPPESACILFLVADHGNAYFFPDLSSDEQNRLRSSPFLQQIALLQEADAESCWLDRKGNERLPSRWDQFFPSS